ncbi:High-affinity potassium transport protein [Apiospora rasikravindrae]|uniref:Potassium transport protein n=1 Tax=Apiospora rasikravindrae TaxID=990691 RepID=A0ABR1RQ22_9PEZI
MKSHDGDSTQRPLLTSALDSVRSYLPPLNYITLHYAYFVVVCMVFSLIHWGASNPHNSISYTDSLFLVVSAMTEAGLNTVNLSEMTTFQQVLLCILIMLGSSIWVSIWTVLARKHAFETRFEDIVRRERAKAKLAVKRNDLALNMPIMQKLSRTFRKSKTLPDNNSHSAGPSDLSRGLTSRNPATGSVSVLPISSPVAVEKLSEPVPKSHAEKVNTEGQGGLDASTNLSPTNDHIAFVDDLEASRPKTTSSAYEPSRGIVRRHVPGSRDDGHIHEDSGTEMNHQQYLTSQKIGRNAQFHDLTAEERDHLGGTEYRALKVLSIVVPAYFFLWQVLGCIALGAWISTNQPGPANDNAINPWWNGIFNGISAFNNSGMSVLDANMIPYGSSYFVLIVMGALILAGNTAYPVFLRFWLWSMLKSLELLTYEHSYRDLKSTLEYILKATWWLLFMLFMLNGTDWVAFEVLNLGNASLAHIPIGSRIIDGLFQALAVRSGGFYVVNIPGLYIGLQVLYVIMMYISVYPVVITMRHSNVYEERSLGLYAEDVEAASITSTMSSITPQNTNTSRKRPGSTSAGLLNRTLRRAMSEWQGVGAARQKPTGADDGAESRTNFISHQVRGQLSHDLWLLVVAVLFIMIIETRHFLEDPVTYSVFNVIFEVTSAYGCVGISTGVPGAAFSFSGGMYTGSKLILVLVMLRGRHRGLPVALDRAVRLPGDDLEREEEEDHQIRRSISARRPSSVGGDLSMRGAA